MDSNVEKVRNILKEHGHKFTRQRVEIYKVFLNKQGSHLSTEEVYQEASEKDKNIGIATVYRTMLLFEEVGILDKISFDDGVTRYELKNESGEKHRHHHLICVDCGKVTEVKLDLLDNLEKEIEEEENFTIVDHSLKFYGHCKECSEKMKKEDKENR